MLEVGSIVGPYSVEALIGEGDLASTYRVAGRGGTFALRVLVVRDQEFSERLKRASAALVSVDHPNLLRVIELIEVDRLPGVVSEYVDGTNLEEWIASGPHRASQVLFVFRQMVEGVGAAHRAGLLHRNLKPSKILIGTDVTGALRVKVADFLLGKARAPGGPSTQVTQLGTTFGTPQYMSPEQFRGAASVDERGDLFALGCLLYEMATGQRAFDGSNLLEVYQQVCACEYKPLEKVRPGLPAWLGEVVDMLLRPALEDRIQTAHELLEKLRIIEASVTITTPPPAPRTVGPPVAVTTRTPAGSEAPSPRAVQTGGALGARGTPPSVERRSSARPAHHAHAHPAHPAHPAAGNTQEPAKPPAVPQLRPMVPVHATPAPGPALSRAPAFASTNSRDTRPQAAALAPRPSGEREAQNGADRHRHSADRHSADRHSADRHSADRHSADRHSADGHSADRHDPGPPDEHYDPTDHDEEIAVWEKTGNSTVLLFVAALGVGLTIGLTFVVTAALTITWALGWF